MLIKTIVTLGFLVSTTVVAKTTKTVEEKRLKTNLKLGIAAPETSNGQETKRKVFSSIELDVRYAVHEKVAGNLSIAKWIGEGSFSNGTGGLAYGISAGGTVALTGKLIDRKTSVEKTVRVKKQTKKSDFYIIKKQNWEKDDRAKGFRLGAHVSQFDFVELKDTISGWGGSLYYEQPWGSKYSSQFGMKGDFINDQKIKANLYQVYISVGF